MISISLETFLFFNDSSNMIFKGIVTDSLQVFVILIEILLHPCDLLESNDLFCNTKRIYSGVGLI